PIHLQDSFDVLAYPLEWSPDQTQLAYIWADAINTYSISILNTKTWQTLTFGMSQDRLLIYPGWSPDGNYFAVTIQKSQGTTIKIWSLHDSQFVKTLTLTGLASLIWT